MSERRSRGRISDAGLFFLTMLITVAMCAIWVAASAEPWQAPRTADGQPDVQASAPGSGGK